MTGVKPILGRNMRNKKVVSSSGLELGMLAEMYFEDGGKISHILVKPDAESREVRNYVDKSGFISIPFSEVRAMSKYVLVDFPPSK